MDADRQQMSLLGAMEARAVQQSAFENIAAATVLSSHELAAWKARIASFQTSVLQYPTVEQTSLFASEPDPAVTLDPFSLAQQNTEFWRWQTSDTGTAALYFVIDYQAQLLLYVGETVKANQRWKGDHDCKRYLLNYRQAHYHHGLESQLGIAFWRHAPTERQARQQLESALIARWRAPFNKENWKFWGTPFVGT